MQVFDREMISKLVFRGRNGISSATWAIDSDAGVTSEAAFEIAADGKVRFSVSERRDGDRIDVVAGEGVLDQEDDLHMSDEAAEAFQTFLEVLSLQGVERLIAVD